MESSNQRNFDREKRMVKETVFDQFWTDEYQISFKKRLEHDFDLEIARLTKRYRVPQGSRDALEVREIAEMLKRKEAMFERTLRIEKEFSHRVLNAFLKWSHEPSPLILWDVDETIGTYDSSGCADFRIRANFLDLQAFIKKTFPHIRQGFLTSRRTLGKELETELHGYISTSEFYSSRGAEMFDSAKDALQVAIKASAGKMSDWLVEKIAALERVRATGVNAKLIDDLSDFGTYLEDRNVGLSVNGLFPHHEVLKKIS